MIKTKTYSMRFPRNENRNGCFLVFLVKGSELRYDLIFPFLP